MTRKMTQKECKQDPITAIVNGYNHFCKIGEWYEDENDSGATGAILELVEIHKTPARFVQVSYVFLNEKEERMPLERGETVWLKIGKDELIEWV